MRRPLTAAIALALLVAAPAVARSQSLAAVAAQSEGRNGAAVKTYTNADVAGDAATGAKTVSPAVEIADPKPVAVPEKPGPAAGRIEESGEGHTNLVVKPGKSASSENEPYWRQTIKNVKDRIATAEAELRLIDTRIPTANQPERERLVQTRAKVQQNLGFLNAEYGGHLKRAQLLGVPPEWLR